MEKISKTKRFIICLAIAILIAYRIIILAHEIISIRDYLPLHLDFASIRIETPDASNPREKLMTYKICAINYSKETVKLKYHFTKDKDAESWYPYYNTIPDEYISETVTLNPDEKKDYINQFKVNSHDERLITSSFYEVNVQYEVIE